MNPALWADVRRDLDAASRFADGAVRRAASLERGDLALDPDAREDREAAIGLLLHNCYGSMEAALERLIKSIDGDVPAGSSFHSNLILRAQTEIEGMRPPMISVTTARKLQKLRAFRHVFRHAYDGFDYNRAAENVPLAEAVVQALRDHLERFRDALDASG